MDNLELIYSFIIGIASGIVSSVLVTVFYRMKDSEKERQAYFANLRAYMSKMLIPEPGNIAEMIDFYCSNELPTIFWWIRLKKSEYKIVAEASEKILNLQELISQYSEEQLKLVEESKPQEDIDEVLAEKYLPKIAFARAEILVVSLEVKSLGNKTLKRIRKNTRN